MPCRSGYARDGNGGDCKEYRKKKKSPTLKMSVSP